MSATLKWQCDMCGRSEHLQAYHVNDAYGPERHAPLVMHFRRPPFWHTSTERLTRDETTFTQILCEPCHRHGGRK
jgi:hypothetical protein